MAQTITMERIVATMKAAKQTVANMGPPLFVGFEPGLNSKGVFQHILAHSSMSKKCELNKNLSPSDRLIAESTKINYIHPTLQPRQDRHFQGFRTRPGTHKKWMRFRCAASTEPSRTRMYGEGGAQP
jgi:hypothetical protein